LKDTMHLLVVPEFGAVQYLYCIVLFEVWLNCGNEGE
jgi:hypothetical protein